MQSFVDSSASWGISAKKPFSSWEKECSAFLGLHPSPDSVFQRVWNSTTSDSLFLDLLRISLQLFVPLNANVQGQSPLPSQPAPCFKGSMKSKRIYFIHGALMVWVLARNHLYLCVCTGRIFNSFDETGQVRIFWSLKVDISMFPPGLPFIYRTEPNAIASAGETCEFVCGESPRLYFGREATNQKHKVKLSHCKLCGLL